MTEITKPHDLFFKEVFSQPDVAESFVLNFLPPNVTGHLKHNSFRPNKGSFVDERLKEHSGESYMESILDRWMNEGIEKGREQGLEQGREQGLELGMLREAASLTIRLLTRRFGKLDETTKERIRELPLEEVERLGEELLDFPDKSALKDWLERIA